MKTKKPTSIKQIFFDIDGCLTNGKHNEIDLMALIELKELLSKIKASKRFCTGRSQPYAELMGQILGIKTENSPSILEHGCALNYTRKNKDETIISPSIDTNMRVALANVKNIFENDDSIIVEPGKDISISLNPTNQTIEELYTYIVSKISKITLRHLNIKASAESIDISPAGISKGSAISLCAEEESFNLENTIMIGDSPGDWNAFRVVGHPACPANADNETKRIVLSHGGYVASQKNTRGVIEILKHYFDL